MGGLGDVDSCDMAAKAALRQTQRRALVGRQGSRPFGHETLETRGIFLIQVGPITVTVK
jgi:hypothetical protein